MLQRRTLISSAALAALGLGTTYSEGEEAWPSRPVKIVLPTPAGGLNDILARLLQEPISRQLGQPVVVEYKPGAGGAIAARYVLSQPADGYTYFLNSSGIVTLPLVQKTPAYDALKDFAPISMIANSPLVLMTHISVPATLKDFVQEAVAKPGSMEWGSSSLGGAGHLTTELFHEMAGIKKMVMVPYPGGSPATQALLAGQIKYMFSTPSTATAALVKEGRLRILGVSTAERSSLLPDVQSIGEVVRGYDTSTWFALLARAGVPAQATSRLADALAIAAATPEIHERMRGMYVEPQTGTQVLADAMRRDHATWSRVIKANNIVID